MGDTDQRVRLLHNEQFAIFYGSVPIAKTPNPHAGPSQAEMRKDQEAQMLVVSQPLPLALLVFKTLTLIFTWLCLELMRGTAQLTYHQ